MNKDKTAALRELAEKYTEDYDRGIGYCPNPERANELLSDLTALINEHYVAKEDAGYPLKFIEWLIKDQEIFFGELNDRYIINDNPHAADGKALNTIDAFYALWNEIQNEPFENTDI